MFHYTYTTYLCLSIYPVEGHLGCCCLLAIVNSDAMNVSVQIYFLRPCFQLFGYRTGGEITGSYGNSIFSILLLFSC